MMPHKTSSLLAAVLLFFSLSTAAKVQQITNFNQAKAAAVKINRDAPGSFLLRLCHPLAGQKGIPDPASCGYQVRKSEMRANRIE
ncbi:MAG: Nuclease NucM [Sodalis sp.]|nr:MAG: Nuclease NucM [Sodalis sp.]